jgi:hypothetical protein
MVAFATSLLSMISTKVVQTVQPTTPFSSCSGNNLKIIFSFKSFALA